MLLSLLFFSSCHLNLQETKDNFSDNAYGTFSRPSVPRVMAPIAQNIQAPNTLENSTIELILDYFHSQSIPATSCEITNLFHVTITKACECLSGVCRVGMKGNPSYFGPASFSYRVYTSGIPSNNASVSMNIDFVDDAPVAGNINAASVSKNTQALINLSYIDEEGDLATSCTVLNPINITVSQPCVCNSGVCVVGVTGAMNYTGPATFNYTVTANGNTSNTALVNFTINYTNTPPVAANITAPAFAEDSESIITLDYSDIDNDLASACTISSPVNVTVTRACACVTGICTVGVTGTTDFYGPGSFNYTVTANGQNSSSALVSFNITPVDDSPVALPITPPDFNEDTQSILTLLYADPESDLASSCTIESLNYVIITQSCACTAGVCTVGVRGNSNYYGPGNITYSVTANGKNSNIALASFTILPVDDAPVVSDITSPSINMNTQGIITLPYTDVENDQATSCNLSSVSNVTVTQGCACASGVCTVGVTGVTNYTGPASFNYTVTANITSNLGTSTFSIVSTNTAPVANNMTPAALDEDVETILTLSYSDIDNDLATSCSLTNLSNVSITQSCACASGVCTVGLKGPANYYGAASFDFSVVTAGVPSNTASAMLTINAVDDAPVASDLTPAPFNEDTQSIITLMYSDVENDLAVSCAITSSLNVTETQACTCSAGVCTVGVTGVANYYGPATFNYTVTTNALASAPASATLTIYAVDDAPVANDLTPSAFDEDTQSIITLSYTDVESDLANSCSISGLSNVTVTQSCACVAGTCTVGVTGTANYSGAAGFSYAVVANGQTSNTATATLYINSIDDAPVAINLTPAAFDEDSISTINLIYTDQEFDLATSCSVFNLVNVTVTSSCVCTLGSCSVNVRGTADYYGPASFDYTVTANTLTSLPATASLTISAVDDAPVANSFTADAFDEDTSSIITLSYTDVENHQALACSVSGLTKLTVSQACACSAGICTVGVTGTLNSNGPVSFQFTVTANGLTSNTGTVSATLNPVDDAPVAANITPAAFDENTQGLITLSYSDPDNDQATSCSISALNQVTVTQACACTSGICTVGVTGVLDYNGAASFSYTVTANSVTSNTATAILSINSVNSLPVISAISGKSTFLNTTSGAIAFTITDPDDPLFCNSTNLSMTSSNPSLVPNSNVAWSGSAPNCSATITPLTNKFGTSTITFTVNDGSGGTASASFTFTVSNGTISLEWRKDGEVIYDHDYGDPTGNTSKTFQIYNTGTGVTNTMSITISGNSNHTAIPPNHDCTVIGPNSYCTVTLNWKENGGGAAGVKTGTATGSDGTYSSAITVRGIN